jgi:hypothetical protein
MEDGMEVDFKLTGVLTLEEEDPEYDDNELEESEDALLMNSILLR